MLNANAKAFVPKGTGEIVDYLSGAPSNAFYRYCLNVPSVRVCDTSEPEPGLSCIIGLLTKRCIISSSQGGTNEETLQLFLADFFNSVENVPHALKKSKSPTGILLSRTIISLSGICPAIKPLEEASGFLIRVDVSKIFRDDVANQLQVAWVCFFENFRTDFRMTSIGYVCTSSGHQNEQGYGESFRHYFFISCIPWKSQLEPFNVNSIMECNFPIIHVARVNSIVPFVCNSLTPIIVIVSVGETTTKKLLSDGKADRTLYISFFPHDVSKTLKSLDDYTDAFLSILRDETIQWGRTYVVLVEIKICKDSSVFTPCPMPMLDVVQFIGNLCDDTCTNIGGVCFNNEDIQGDNEQLATTGGEDNGCYINATLQSVLQDRRLINISSIFFGRFPEHIKRPITTGQYEFVHKQIKNMFVFEKPTLLTRKVFADAADNFANKQYYVRHKVVGESVLLVTDKEGGVFAVDKDTGGVVALRNCFGGTMAPVENSIFEGVVTSSFRGYRECVIILVDVLCFEGSDVRDLPFSQRWEYVEKRVPDDQMSRPHSNPDHVVILRAIYSSFDRAEQILKDSPTDHPTMGLVFVPSVNEGNENKKPFVYSWVPPESITARFIAGNVSDLTETKGEVRRVEFCVADAKGGIVSYNGEYADFLRSAYPLLKSGSALECMLQRSDDGAHWWEVLKDFHSRSKQKPHLYEEVDHLVHVPGLSLDEMIWLFKAPIYKCGRCKSVSDIGKTNPKTQTYWCQKCWEMTGHGECVYCGRCFGVGKLDGVSERFYCDNCWGVFATTNTNAESGYLVPPPPNASFATQVLTRCISLLIDVINLKAPTNDILDLCCGGAATRKWIKNKTTRYVGFDLKGSVVESTTELISSLNDKFLENASYNVICADAFSTDLWTQHITRIHPQQFHAITCFSGLHHAFDADGKARHVVGSVANALVPGGTFLGCFLDASTLYTKGECSNELFSVDWDEGFVPRMGHHFYISMKNEPKKKINVIPIDFLVAVAREYHLSVIPEVCLTFREILENDGNWTKVPSKSEKEYLCAMRTFAFRKDSDPQNPLLSKIGEKAQE